MGKNIFNLRLFGRMSVLLVMLLCCTAAVKAQDAASWKEKPITLRVSNQTLGKVLEMVAEAANAKLTLQEVSGHTLPSCVHSTRMRHLFLS